MIGSANRKRLPAIVVFALLALVAGSVSALALTVIVAAVLTALAVWEYPPDEADPRPVGRTADPSDLTPLCVE